VFSRDDHWADEARHHCLALCEVALIQMVTPDADGVRNEGVKPASLSLHVKGIHYAWVTLGIAIATAQGSVSL